MLKILLDIASSETTKYNSIKVPKVSKPRNKRTWFGYKTLGTSVMSLYSLKKQENGIHKANFDKKLIFGEDFSR